MIEEYAVVVQCQQGLAELEIERRTACGICGQKRGCGNATWGKLVGHKTQTFIAQNAIHAKVGDSVVVGIDERVALRSVFFLYVVPLLSLIIFSVVADVLAHNQLYVMVSAIFGLLIGFVWVKSHLVDDTKQQAIILRHADGVSSCDVDNDAKDT
ncbi:SoxR reducing system RseC family protein [Methylotenera sp. L2L1]|uniref:SoxR reducing system RseC family protein n=1 Tax=Methylotenera sp. L2L1 TaxID=1502770 RepID=UPI00056696D8|nr:SoxR reducing system RseC family protein [Methylotenera sp. L2L1]